MPCAQHARTVRTRIVALCESRQGGSRGLRRRAPASLNTHASRKSSRPAPITRRSSAVHSGSSVQRRSSIISELAASAASESWMSEGTSRFPFATRLFAHANMRPRAAAVRGWLDRAQPSGGVPVGRAAISHVANRRGAGVLRSNCHV